ncbi:glycerol-3-phosphate 1-O-acyltransferase PlsB [Lacimicrobium sp. SS2-24]|uniref:glycerol-3-phosphate 1-O-acyltransferase PlsB n=1 Tax=Lacimicrobium sp. SS2-24 TaxID=2005569 RepID=UPI000B4B1673|nr:glycerol-3-phosphate 1-O-acyltransferase PlsB [Lacimicrobium sp. SS2-24]
MHWLHRLLLTLISLPTRLLVSTKVIPANLITELGIDTTKPIIYLLHTHSATDLLALQQATRQAGLADPTEPVTLGGEKRPACLYLEQPQGLFSRRVKQTSVLQDFTRILELQQDDDQLDVQIVPVSVFWGRAPEKSKPGWSDLLADRASPSWLRKFFIVLFLGRDNFVTFSRAVSSQRVAQESGDHALVAHKLIRVARTHFYRKVQSMTGPSSVDKHQLYNAVLGARAVKQAIAEEQQSKKITAEQARDKAKEYLKEIAADYREGIIRFGDRLLTRVWNKIYNGIDVSHAAKVRELAQKGHEIIYVPCHRSHMDYLLLTYVIYHEGLATPHIAAGINLNFWPVGGIFRRGGAFFLRRSFAGNKLYTAVFREYLELLFDRGYPVKYYPEGGRSRTGRLLPPKTGMLAMTLQAMLKGVKRPVSIVPVYLGYENVMELGSYLNELKGKKKQKESFLQVFSAIKKLKNYGHGFLSFGDPISLNQYLDQQVPTWRNDAHEKKPTWLTPTVNHLAHQVMCRINQAASVSGMSLVSLALLACKNHTASESELTANLDHLLQLLRDAPFSELCVIPQISGEELLSSTLALKKLQVQRDSFGRIISLDERLAVTQTYYRNNILHLFALPGLVAASIAGKGAEKKQVLTTVELLYPLLSKELFIYMSVEQATDYAETLIKCMKTLGLIRQQGRKLVVTEHTGSGFGTLAILNRTIQPTLQRYAMVLNVLQRERSLSRAELERQSRELAEHLCTITGIDAPEFYDKTLFSTFIQSLKDNKWVDASTEGSIQYSEKSEALQTLVMEHISPDVAQKLTHL